MTKHTAAAVAPRLRATSVDFNALNAACAKGDDAAQAFAEKLNNPEPPKKAAPAPTPPAARGEA